MFVSISWRLALAKKPHRCHGIFFCFAFIPPKLRSAYKTINYATHIHSDIPHLCWRALEIVLNYEKQYLSGTTGMNWYQKGKTNLDFAEARDSG